jgi:hypothetical protein
MKNYQSWEIKRWDTPLSDLECSNLVLQELTLGEYGLTLILESEVGIFSIHFNGHPPFRVIDEGFRGDLWIKLRQQDKSRLGNTLTVENSDFKDFLRLDGHFDSMASDYIHYLIVTDNDVVEVLSRIQPTIQKKLGSP